ncbi:hypothetical protein [Dongia sp.]|uniref:hypothetical protein n=1 Tax=Dongia sp. TaxID=1977262 RepID=UPI0035AE11F8
MEAPHWMLAKLRPLEDLPTWEAADMRRRWNVFARALQKKKFIAIVDKGRIVTVAIEPKTYHRLQKAAIASEQRRHYTQLLTVLQITREKLAKVISVRPGENENIERWTDIYLGTLRTYLWNIGGELNIEIRLGDNSVSVDSFEDILPVEEKA